MLSFLGEDRLDLSRPILQAFVLHLDDVRWHLYFGDAVGAENLRDNMEAHMSRLVFARQWQDEVKQWPGSLMRRKIGHDCLEGHDFDVLFTLQAAPFPTKYDWADGLPRYDVGLGTHEMEEAKDRRSANPAGAQSLADPLRGRHNL